MQNLPTLLQRHPSAPGYQACSRHHILCTAVVCYLVLGMCPVWESILVLHAIVLSTDKNKIFHQLTEEVMHMGKFSICVVFSCKSIFPSIFLLRHKITFLISSFSCISPGKSGYSNVHINIKNLTILLVKHSLCGNIPDNTVLGASLGLFDEKPFFFVIQPEGFQFLRKKTFNEETPLIICSQSPCRAS